MSPFVRHLPRYLFGLLCLLALLGHVGGYWRVPFISSLDNYLYDVRLRLLMPDTLDERIVIVDIDEKSLAAIGRWPWNREVMATLVEQLTDKYQAEVIGMDVVFAEPDESSGLRVLEALGQSQLRDDRRYQNQLADLRESLDYDRHFAETLRGRPIVLGFYLSNKDNAQRSGALPAPSFSPDAFSQFPEQILGWRGYGGNLPIFQQAAAGGGHFNSLADSDGVTRRVALVAEHEGQYYDALSLAMLRVMLGDARLKPGYPDNRSPMEWIDLESAQATLQVPIDRDAAALVPYRGRQGSFPYVSAVDILKGLADPALLLGRIILIGTSAPGLTDLRATPVGGSYPGVEVHANLLAGLLDGTVREQPNYLMGAEMLILLLAAGSLILLLPQYSPVRGSLLALLVLSVVLALNAYLWNRALIVLPLAATLVAVSLIYGFNMAYGFFFESRVKRQLAGLFGQYVPPELVDVMAQNPTNYSMEGRNEELTVLFSDVRSFTTISEGLDPKELSHLMNAYMGAMTTVIRDQRGTLDKYIGDAIMAFWGAPVSDPQHAQHAVEAALAMQEALAKLADPFKARGWPVLKIGIGINTGTMTVGDMGSQVRKAYTVMGDAVNLGSRLEGITKEYGVGILVGDETRRQTHGIVFKELDRVRVKGKHEPIAIHVPIGREADVTPAMRTELLAWERALDLYRGQQWGEARQLLGQLHSVHPDALLYSLYLDRIEYLQATPPGEDWDGVTTFKTK